MGVNLIPESGRCANGFPGISACKSNSDIGANTKNLWSKKANSGHKAVSGKLNCAAPLLGRSGGAPSSIFSQFWYVFGASTKLQLRCFIDKRNRQTVVVSKSGFTFFGFSHQIKSLTIYWMVSGGTILDGSPAADRVTGDKSHIPTFCELVPQSGLSRP